MFNNIANTNKTDTLSVYSKINYQNVGFVMFCQCNVL